VTADLGVGGKHDNVMMSIRDNITNGGSERGRRAAIVKAPKAFMTMYCLIRSKDRSKRQSSFKFTYVDLK
jgi:hypothetical protein